MKPVLAGELKVVAGTADWVPGSSRFMEVGGGVGFVTGSIRWCWNGTLKYQVVLAWYLEVAGGVGMVPGSSRWCWHGTWK